MDEQQGQFLKAIYAAQNEIGRARVLDIARHLGLDIRNSRADRSLYHETALELQKGGYIESLAIDEWVTCGIVRLTAKGLDYVEESKRRAPVT
jgi:Mn-dependent DtxR family transcriptional regulator